MDVEAQDSGILAKILVPDGTQKVDVGKVIAVLAEEGDDISSVEMPVESLETSSTEPAHQVEDAIQTSRDAHKPLLKFENTYLPAVLRLLQQYGIEDPTQIQGTGPNGRLLKGDVLAHVGTIKSDIPKSLQRILEEKQRLDLSNIVVQRAQDKLQPPAGFSEVSTKPPPFARIEETVCLTAALQVQKEISGFFQL
jgi:pyruvate/2-oxoglutarate dehydrogenase complex dihydrolipoamide acyltransferase (E2) component